MKALSSIALLYILFSTPSLAVEFPCEAVGDVEPICGINGAEDMVNAPNGRDMVVAEFGEGGSLGILDTTTRKLQRLYPTERPANDSQPGWGATDCPGPIGSDLSPHGIDINQRDDGRWQVLAVNHGVRESIEYFELLTDADSGYQLVWRGCVIAPPLAYLNDVAGLRDGGFLATHMMDSDSVAMAVFSVLIRRDTGFVYDWNARDGFRKLDGTSGIFPNGIVVSVEEDAIYVNYYMESQVKKFTRAGALVASAEVNKPDNINWNPDGKLLVAAHMNTLWQLVMQLITDGAGPNPLPFAVVEVDPETMTTKTLFSHEGAPMGGATVATEWQQRLYIGTYGGDRVITTKRD